MPLAINVIFHPLFLALIGLTVRIPAARNTALVVDHVRKLVHDDSATMETVFKVKAMDTRNAWDDFLSLYGLTFVLSYGLMAWVLTVVLHFNILSTILFRSFLVSNVLWNQNPPIRSRASFLIAKAVSSVLCLIFSCFRRASGDGFPAVAKSQRLYFLFRFYREAPFKLAIEMIEGWVAFIREKKEEL